MHTLNATLIADVTRMEQLVFPEGRGHGVNRPHVRTATDWTDLRALTEKYDPVDFDPHLFGAMATARMARTLLGDYDLGRLA